MAKENIINNFSSEEKEVVAPTEEKQEIKTESSAEQPKETVQVEAQFLKNLMERVEALEGKPRKTSKVTEHFAYIRQIDSKVVTGVKRFWNEKALSPINDKDEKRLFAEVMTQGSDQTIKLDWLDFINDGDNKVNVKIIKETGDKKIHNQGTIMSVNLDEYNNKKFVPGEIDLDVISVEYVYDVEALEGVLSGQKINLKAEALNI